MKKSFVLLCSLSLASLSLVACGGGTSTSAQGSSTNTSTSSKSNSGGFSFTPIVTSSTSSTEAPVTSSTVKEPEAYVLATIDHNADMENKYVVEAEDCDTTGCTLQAGCASFIESPNSSFPTSGEECLACIAAPSILAFKIDVKATCDITFYTVSSKYENPWSLDSNVSYYLDNNDPFVTNYQDFGHTDSNQWYNWKTIELGTTTGVSEGVHQFNINVKGAFPNTDCFYLVVSNYSGTITDTGTSSSVEA